MVDSISITVFLITIKNLSTKWWLLFAEAASWHYLGEIQDCVVLVLCEISIRCPIMNCARIGQCLWLISGSLATFVVLSPNQILPPHSTHETWMFVHLYGLFTQLLFIGSQPTSHWTKAIHGQQMKHNSCLKELLVQKDIVVSMHIIKWIGCYSSIQETERGQSHLSSQNCVMQVKSGRRVLIRKKIVFRNEEGNGEIM